MRNTANPQLSPVQKTRGAVPRANRKALKDYLGGVSTSDAPLPVLGFSRVVSNSFKV
jgi:hypothetical protein